MTQAGPTSRYSVRRAEITAEAEAILRLWLDTYPNLDPAYARHKFESQYVHTPSGRGICMFLDHGDANSPVGVQCLGPRRFSFRKHTMLAGIIADYVVDARHRSLGPALTLLKGTLSVGHGALTFLYGFPNQKSEVIVRRLGMRSPGAITRFVRLLRCKSFAARRLNSRWKWLLPVVGIIGDRLLAIENILRIMTQGQRWQWSEQEDFDDFFDECWQAGRRGDWLIAERSRATLSWRFPNGTPRRISVAVDRGSGKREGYVVWHLSDNAVEILDVFCRQPECQLTGLLATFAHRARKLGVESIGLEFGGSDQLANAIAQAGYRARDRHRLFLSAAEGSEINSIPLESMFITGFDRD